MGKYRIERLVGMGGMGAVIEAEHLHLGERVAIKFLLADGAKRPDRVERFSREAWAAAKIKSDHVARVMDVGTAPSGDFYMVMEFLEGEDLSRLLRRAALPIPKAVDFILQASEALSEAHRLGIVHRDLKPANLFVTRRPDGSDHLKVLDFGISKFGASSSNLTKTSALLGSPLYMAPEQLTSTKSADTRADIWALGVILFEMITNDLPFEGDSLPEICTKVLYEPARRLRELLPAAPAALDDAIDRCLAKEREHRFSDLCELVDAIARLGGDDATRSAAYVRGVLRSDGGGSRPRLASWLGEDTTTTSDLAEDSTTNEHIPVPPPAIPSQPRPSTPSHDESPVTVRFEAAPATEIDPTAVPTIASPPLGMGTVTAEPVWRPPPRPNHAAKGVVAAAGFCLLLGGAAAMWLGSSPEEPIPPVSRPAADADVDELKPSSDEPDPESSEPTPSTAEPETGPETHPSAQPIAQPARSASPTNAPPHRRPPATKPEPKPSILDKQF
jgi:eukaryotic-like serine/threonine-protein kinase